MRMFSGSRNLTVIMKTLNIISLLHDLENQGHLENQSQTLFA